jgi:hypothetical protein
MANASVIRRWMRKAARLLDNGDGSYSPLVGVAPGVAVVAGFSVADTPAANTIIVDSGPLPAGDYRVEFDLFGTAPNAAYVYIRAERTNAAPTADHVAILPSPGAVRLVWSRITLVANGRFRIVSGPVVWPASVGGGALRAYKLS